MPEIIDKLFLELSHCTTAKTERELGLEKALNSHNEAMSKIPTISRPQTAAEGLRFLASWFDAVYKDAGINDAVQIDLRRWADEFERSSS